MDTSVFSEFRKSSAFCDGVIVCADAIEIQVHRVILSAVSSYFKAHFKNCLNPGSPAYAEAKVDAPSHIFIKILDFAYTGQCTIERDTVELLLRTADQYHVLGVIQRCCRYLLDHLNPTNCLGILRIARHYFCTDLESEVKRYIVHNFSKLLNEGDEFNNLAVEEVIEILEDDELNVRNEEFVYDSVRRWISVNPMDRKNHLLRLLKCVRVRLLTENPLTWSLVLENENCQNYLIETMRVDATESDVMNIDNAFCRPRVPHDIIFAIGGKVAGFPTNFFETYDPRAGHWLMSSQNNHNITRAEHGLCSLNGCIYMVGGYNGNDALNTVMCFDPINFKWTGCACMHYPRARVSVAIHDNKIYAMGGYNRRSVRMSSAERYNPRCDHWEGIKPMQRQRSSASAAVLNDKIYIVGGTIGVNRGTRSAEVYDTMADQWTLIPYMLSARYGLSLVAFKNTLYAFGGRNNANVLATGEKFIPGVSRRWEWIKKMCISRECFATVVLDDLIFVIGGNNGTRRLNCVESYDTESNKWTIVSPLTMPRDDLGACILSGLPNARVFAGRMALDCHDDRG